MRAVLFDLDGTLLDIDINGFIRTYFRALAPVVANVVGSTPEEGIAAIIDATNRMLEPHPDQTNEEVFAERFAQVTHTELTPEHWAQFDEFYAEVFPTLRGAIGPRAGAREAVTAGGDAGLKIAVATNPIFPRAAIMERLAWAGLDDVEFDLITTYEMMRSTKPHGSYFLEVSYLLAVPAKECLMVGDDVQLDLGANTVGMTTFYVGPPPVPRADHVGDLYDVARLLRSFA